MKKFILLFLVLFCLDTGGYGQITYTPFFRESTPTPTYTPTYVSGYSSRSNSSSSVSRILSVPSCVMILPNDDIVTDVNVVIDFVDGKPYSSSFVLDGILVICHDSYGDIPRYSIERTIDVDPSMSIKHPYYVVYTSNRGDKIIVFLPSLIREKVVFRRSTLLFRNN